MKILAAVALFCVGTTCAIEAAERAPHVVLFRAAGFPAVDAAVIPDDVLADALNGLSVERLDDLRQLGNADVLILPYGSAFPIEAWLAIRTYLNHGGNLAVLGGAPFHQPVLRTAAGWQMGTRQPTFAHELLIGPAEEISASGLHATLPDHSWTLPIDGTRRVWELTVRLATTVDSPSDFGSEGFRDAVLRPLVHLSDSDGLPRACPLVEIDRLRGDAAGGRWILAPSDAPLDAAIIRAIVLRALEGASDLRAKPIDASVEAGETPRIHITARNATDVTVTVYDDVEEERYRTSIVLTGAPESREAEVAIPRALPAGLYHVEVRAGKRSTTTGFWMRDAALFAHSPRMTVSSDWLRRDGRVFPVIGTTYMASDAHRKFLFEPNPHAWDADFARMHNMGINLVRTGIWTGWSIGAHELRALDAYVQTAAKHNIVIAFTFFAFLPQAYGGVNPYLDPRSIAGQSEFVSRIASRYRGVGWIHYDLINEPSYAPPDALWQNRPIGDEWERRAWIEWVHARHGDDVAALRNAWQDRDEDVFGLPRSDEFGYAAVRESRRPRKDYDFTLFTNDVVARWARHLREVLRSAGGGPLVTVGQDEGGTGNRPSQQLHDDAVDYTSVHPWWQNDDVLSTGVFAKVPEKPVLFQETGLMRLEDVSGFPWRADEAAASLLDRKFADAFAARGTGAVEWAWNINPYMPIDNESTIGFFRPDGTAKAEIDVVPRYAAFFRAAAPWLDDFDADSVVVIIPQSRLFMNRPAALDGFRRIVRVLAERFGVGVTAVSDLRITDDRLRQARLIIVPSVEFLDAAASNALLDAAHRGTKILFTGAVTGDAYGDVASSLRALQVADHGRPVQFHEHATRGGWATFDRNLQESLLRSTGPPLDAFTGNVWHEPLPVEFAREIEPLAALMHEALQAASVQTQPSAAPVTLRLLEAPRAILAVFVNDSPSDVTRTITVSGRATDVLVPAGRSRLILFDRATGTVIVQSR